MKNQNINLKSAKQSGFTLIELLTVVVILGILAYVSMSAFSGSPDSANATAVRSAATELAKGVGYINANMGTGIKTTSNSVNKLLGTSSTMLDVLVVGSSAVSTNRIGSGSNSQTYQEKFESLGMRPLESEIRVLTRPAAGGAGTYSVMNYPVKFVDTKGDKGVDQCPDRKVCVQFTQITTPVLEELLGRFGMSYNEAGDEGENMPVAYGVAGADLTHTVLVKLVP